MLSARAAAWVVVLCLAAFCGAGAHAEWVTQEVTLNPGWNAVYLTLQPVPGSCEEVFRGVPIRSVWVWNKRFSPMQYVRDPATLVPKGEDWLTYFPADSQQAFLTTLHAVLGGRACLIDYAGAEPTVLTLRGEAVSHQPDWLSDSFNFVGFDIDPANPPTVSRFFSPAPELTSRAVYRLDQAGRWNEIADPARETLRSGEAYLIYCKGASSFAGPVSVRCPIPGGLEYGHEMTTQTLTLRNDSDQPKTLTLSLAPSVRSASEGSAPLAGEVALYYKKLLAWRRLVEPIAVRVEPHSAGALELGVRRVEMAPPPSPDALFESTLIVEDGEGSLIRVPVSARKSLDDAGLYVGVAVVNAVSEASALDTVTPQPTSSEFRFRIILHKDDRTPPRVHLLQHVTVMQVQPSTVSDPDNPSETIVVPARYVLLADDALIPQYEGVSMRDNVIVGRRISSPAFGFSDPVPLAQNAADSNRYSGSIVTPYDDPLNPFLHRYHPDHDNLNENFRPFTDLAGNDISENIESYTFTRTVRLTFTDDDPDQLGEIAWGYDLLGGVYEETISGVHRNDIHLRGTFRVNRISSVARLDDEL